MVKNYNIRMNYYDLSKKVALVMLAMLVLLSLGVATAVEAGALRNPIGVDNDPGISSKHRYW